MRDDEHTCQHADASTEVSRHGLNRSVRWTLTALIDRTARDQPYRRPCKGGVIGLRVRGRSDLHRTFVLEPCGLCFASAVQGSHTKLICTFERGQTTPLTAERGSNHSRRVTFALRMLFATKGGRQGERATQGKPLPTLSCHAFGTRSSVLILILTSGSMNGAEVLGGGSRHMSSPVAGGEIGCSCLHVATAVPQEQRHAQLPPLSASAPTPVHQQHMSFRDTGAIKSLPVALSGGSTHMKTTLSGTTSLWSHLLTSAIMFQHPAVCAFVSQMVSKK